MRTSCKLMVRYSRPPATSSSVCAESVRRPAEAAFRSLCFFSVFVVVMVVSFLQFPGSRASGSAGPLLKKIGSRRKKTTAPVRLVDRHVRRRFKPRSLRCCRARPPRRRLTSPDGPLFGWGPGRDTQRDEIVPTIERPRLLIVFRIDRLVETVADRVDLGGIHAKIHQVLFRHVRPALSEVQIVFLGSPLIAVSSDLDSDGRVGTEQWRQVGQMCLAFRLEVIPVEIEMKDRLLQNRCPIDRR